MKAYKVWYDTKYFIHKDTTNELDVSWTTDINDAKDIPNLADAYRFFYDELGFNMSSSLPNSLHLY